MFDNFSYMALLFTPLGIFYMPQIYDMGPTAYFPSEGRPAEDFFALKNPTASAGFQPANLGTKGQHATPRPPFAARISRAWRHLAANWERLNAGETMANYL